MGYLLKTFFITIPTLGKQLSGKSALTQIILTYSLWWFVITRKFFKNNTDFLLQAEYCNTKLNIFLRYPMDIAVLREIFIDKEYEWTGNAEPNTIIDMGAHFGDTALYYHARFPDATIIAVEPSPENYERLVKNTKEIPKIIPVQAAVGKFDGVINLSLGASALGYSTLENTQSKASVEVKQVTLPTLLHQYSITKADIIKFDIEGAEFDVFNNPDIAMHSAVFIGEVHTDLVPGSSLQGFLSAFKGMHCDSTRISGKGRYLVKIQK
ncbi:MAG: FkbM family methyltransferase [Patescibacteria group bacterium]